MCKVNSNQILRNCKNIFQDYCWDTFSETNKVSWRGIKTVGKTVYYILLIYTFDNNILEYKVQENDSEIINKKVYKLIDGMKIESLILLFLIDIKQNKE